MSNIDAVEKCNSYGYPDEWTYGALYNHFGERKVKTGRPAKKR